MIADEIKVVLTLAAEKFSIGVQKAGGELRQLESHIHNAASASMKLDAGIDKTRHTVRETVLTLGALRFALMDIKSIFIDMPAHVAQTAGEFERLQKLMEGMSKATTEVEKAREAMRDVATLKDFSKSSPFNIAALQDSFVKFKSAGIDPMSGGFTVLTDAVAKFGGSGESLKRASVAIQQMVGKGVVSMEELRQQLGEAVPTAMKSMADGMGVSMATLADMIKKGTVQAGPALARMFAQMEIDSAGAAAAMMNTFPGALERLKTEFQLFENEIAKGGFLDTLTMGMKDLTTFLEGPEGKDLAKNIGTSFKEAAENAVSGIRWTLTHLSELRQGVIALLSIYGGSKVASLLDKINTRIREQREEVARTAAAEQRRAMALQARQFQSEAREVAAEQKRAERAEKQRVREAAAAQKKNVPLAKAVEASEASVREDRAIAARRTKLAEAHAEKLRMIAREVAAKEVEFQRDIQRIEALRVAQAQAQAGMKLNGPLQRAGLAPIDAKSAIPTNPLNAPGRFAPASNYVASTLGDAATAVRADRLASMKAEENALVRATEKNRDYTRSLGEKHAAVQKINIANKDAVLKLNDKIAATQQVIGATTKQIDKNNALVTAQASVASSSKQVATAAAQSTPAVAGMATATGNAAAAIETVGSRVGGAVSAFANFGKSILMAGAWGLAFWGVATLIAKGWDLITKKARDAEAASVRALRISQGKASEEDQTARKEKISGDLQEAQKEVKAIEALQANRKRLMEGPALNRKKQIEEIDKQIAIRSARAKQLADIVIKESGDFKKGREIVENDKALEGASSWVGSGMRSIEQDGRAEEKRLRDRKTELNKKVLEAERAGNKDLAKKLKEEAKKEIMGMNPVLKDRKINGLQKLYDDTAAKPIDANWTTRMRDEALGQLSDKLTAERDSRVMMDAPLIGDGKKKKGKGEGSGRTRREPEIKDHESSYDKFMREQRANLAKQTEEMKIEADGVVTAAEILQAARGKVAGMKLEVFDRPVGKTSRKDDLKARPANAAEKEAAAQLLAQEDINKYVNKTWGDMGKMARDMPRIDDMLRAALKSDDLGGVEIKQTALDKYLSEISGFRDALEIRLKTVGKTWDDFVGTARKAYTFDDLIKGMRDFEKAREAINDGLEEDPRARQIREAQRRITGIETTRDQLISQAGGSSATDPLQIEAIKKYASEAAQLMQSVQVQLSRALETPIEAMVRSWKNGTKEAEQTFASFAAKVSGDIFSFNRKELTSRKLSAGALGVVRSMAGTKAKEYFPNSSLSTSMQGMSDWVMKKFGFDIPKKADLMTKDGVKIDAGAMLVKVVNASEVAASSGAAAAGSGGPASNGNNPEDAKQPNGFPLNPTFGPMRIKGNNTEGQPGFVGPMVPEGAEGSKTFNGPTLPPGYAEQMKAYSETKTDQTSEQIQQSADKVGDSFGTTMKGALNQMGVSIGGLFDSLGAAIGGSGSKTSAWVSAIGKIGMAYVSGGTSTAKFANGGIMTDFGPMQLRKYANGGVANSPQLALYGEGKMPEAYVPLPDGRTIPVTIAGNLGGGASGGVSVVVNVINQSGQQVAAQQKGGPRFDGKQMILDVVLSASSQPGSFRDGMRGALNG